jgi:hypothetical protein
VVKQLKGLYNITRDGFFLGTSEKWANQAETLGELTAVALAWDFGDNHNKAPSTPRRE